MKRGCIGGLFLVAATTRSSVAQSQDDCFPGQGSNEARSMAIFEVPLAFSNAVAPARHPAWRLHLGVEVSYLPKVDPALAIPTTCRPDKMRPENTDLLLAAPRPRASLTLPAGFRIEAGWIPPVRMSQVKANLVGLALSRTTALRAPGVVLELRAHATFGVIHAPITCDDAALRDSGSICYQGTRSDDAFRPNVIGISSSIGWSLGRSLRPYVGAGYNHLAPRFRVNFTNQFQVVDRRRVGVNLNRGVLFAGVTWNPGRRLDVSGEIYAAPADAITARATVRVRLGP